ncbi:hypothetical protein JCM3770_002025 [Rhodotorula araucariae]
MAPAPRGSASGQTFPCPDCDKVFSRKEYMARHYRSKHSKEKPFECEHCTHAFSRSDLLRRHYKTCTQAKVARTEGESPDAQRASPTEPTAPSASTSATPAHLSYLPFPPPVASTSTLGHAHYAAYTEGAPGLPVPPPSFLQTVTSFPYPASTPSVSPFPTTMANFFSASSSASASSTSPPLTGMSGSPFSHTTYASTSATSPETEQQKELPSLTLAGAVAAISATTRGAPPAPPAHEELPMPTLSVLEPYGTGPPASSAFKAGVMQHDTLAPGLSRTGSFTKDEVLASEVLQDLMRTPFGVSYPAPVSTDGAPWHGAHAAQRAAEQAESAQVNEAVSLVDTSSGDWAFALGSGGAVLPVGGFIGPVSNKLEETPAAQQLAEYFNRGGVGGITALDLGFTAEPSMWPEWLLAEPKPVHDDMKRWFLPEQKFCLGYLFPWHVPPLPVLSGYARKATERLLPALPVLHGPSAVMNELPTHTVFALTVAGGAYEPEGQSFSNEMLVEKRVFLVRGFQEKDKSWEDRFASLQSLLLYQLLGLFHRDEQQRLLSQSFHSALVYMLRALDLPNRVKQTEITKPRPDLSGPELDRAWKDWIDLETKRRVAFIVFLIDLEHAAATDTPQLLALSDLDLDLPACERAWKAENAGDWLESSTSPLYPVPISFLAAIRALLSTSPPEPFSAAGVLLTELGRLSSFPLLILSRTLSYLEKKTKDALAQIDPFKNLLGGLGVIEGRETENRAVLERIRRGREVLRRLPGGIARGGGEGWFNEIIPSAKDFVPAAEDSPAASSSTSAGTSPRDAYAFSSSSASGTASTFPSPHGDASTDASLGDLFAEFDELPYRPFHSAGGATPGETYDEAQERLRKHAERRVRDAQTALPELWGMMP